jgi:leucyl/phenylalanyl-tRNA--protein transferase
MTVYLLPVEPIFPPVDHAEPDGLIAIGGDFSADRLLKAYTSGIFPWFNEQEDIYWYSPDPRMVMFPGEFKPTQSLQRLIKSRRFTVRFDTAFGEVIRGCAEAQRAGQDGTWISRDFIEAYTALYNLGYAHSVEVYDEDQLAGGLYGISLGAAFFGESMFYRKSNASKIAFHALVDHCLKHKFHFIDCQTETSHLLKLGATPLGRKQYMMLLKKALKRKTIPGKWGWPF